MGHGLTEQEIIRRAAARLAGMARDRSVEAGIGDDTAILRLSESRQRHLLTTDTLIEGVHFDLSYMSLAEVGYKALAVSLSDINAMGGESVAALGTLGVPKGATERDIDELLDGVEAGLQLCANAGQSCSLIGGDTVAAPQWLVGFTVLGAVDGPPLLRSGAKAGDMVWHSGVLGLSGVGFEMLRADVGATRASPDDRPNTPVDRSWPKHSASGDARVAPTVHRRPIPPLALGPWLQRSGYASSAQDLSDSLSQVALQLAAASGVGIELDFRDYQFAPELVEFCKESNVESSLAQFLLAQAEDYELLFTTPPEHAQAIAGAPVGCSVIGRVVEAGNSYIDENGERHKLIPVGFEHL